MTIGSKITSVDLKTIQDKAESLLGIGTGNRGYGQPTLSSEVSPGTIIRKSHWDAIRFDVVNLKTHQDGVIPSVVQVNIGDVVQFGASAPNTNYNLLLESALTNRFNIGPGRSIVTNIDTKNYSSSWSNTASCTATITFTGGYTITNADGSTWTATAADHARHFFNSGGKIRVRSAVAGGSTAQSNAWTNFLNSTGFKEFGAATDPTINFYTLTNSYTTFFQSNLTTPYSANNYRLEARCNVADNSNGGATVVEIRLTLRDLYTDPGPPAPGDLVDGTLTMIFEELKAFGPIAPSGNFSVVSPNYSVSSISAS